MPEITHIVEDDTDRTISNLNPLLACLCSVILLFNALSGLNMSIGGIAIPGLAVVIISIATLFVSVFQFYRQRITRLKEPSLDISQVHALVNEYAKSNNEKGRNIILKMMAHNIVYSESARSISNKGIAPDVNELHNYIDKCSNVHGVSGIRLLVAAAVQRIEHQFADMLLNTALWVICRGRVRLNFLDEETPAGFYSDMWFEDIETMVTVRERTKFASCRIADAFILVYEYGSLRRAIQYVTSHIETVKILFSHSGKPDADRPNNEKSM